MEIANKHLEQDWSNMTSEEYAKAGQATGDLLAKAAAARAAQTAATGCAKPLFNVGKKKKAYEKCLADHATSQTPNTTPPYIPAPSKSFISSPAGIATIVGGIALLGTIGFLIYKFR